MVSKNPKVPNIKISKIQQHQNFQEKFKYWDNVLLRLEIMAVLIFIGKLIFIKIVSIFPEIAKYG